MLSRRFATAALLLLAGCAPRVAAPPLASDVPRREPALRVGLLVDTDAVELSAPAGLELTTPGSSRMLARAPAGATVVVSADEAGRIELRVDDGSRTSTDATLVTARAVGDGPVEIDGKPYRGDALVRADGPGRVTAINHVDLEKYLLGVVPAEIGHIGGDEIEAAKAQAVAARTYAIRYLGRRSALGFDVYASTQDQVYGGIDAEFGPVADAVTATAGQILVYGGEPIMAYYHSTCAGRTAAIDEVWNSPPVPYLVSIVDVNPATGQAYDIQSSRFHWVQRWSADELDRILARTLADSLPPGATSVGRLTDIQLLSRTPSGRVKAMRISTTTADFVVGGDGVRWIFRTPDGRILNSSKFDIRVTRDPSGNPTEVVAEGGGWGHGIGMCQVGAMGRAKAGQDYAEILAAYFPHTRLVRIY